MRQYEFNVRFAGGDSVTVMAFNSTEAKILAQAERIKAGLDYTVKSVICDDEYFRRVNQ